MVITVYADSTELFTEEECNLDNLCEIDIPDKILEEYYKTFKAECDAECIANGYDPCFYNYFYWVVTADITDGLLPYAYENYGYKPELAK